MTAQVEPIRLEIQKHLFNQRNSVSMNFSEDSTELSCSQSVKLSNQGNSDAFYSFQQSQTFQITPISSWVKAQSSLQLNITYHPTS